MSIRPILVGLFAITAPAAFLIIMCDGDDWPMIFLTYGICVAFLVGIAVAVAPGSSTPPAPPEERRPEERSPLHSRRFGRHDLN